MNEGFEQWYKKYCDEVEYESVGIDCKAAFLAGAAAQKRRDVEIVDGLLRKDCFRDTCGMNYDTCADCIAAAIEREGV